MQDDYRVTRDLTLNLGLRWEMLPAPRDINNRMQYFDFEKGSLFAFGEPGAVTKRYPTDKNNFAPRFGFAYNPKHGRMVIRGGYGVDYAQPYWNDLHEVIWGLPFYYITSIFANPSVPDLRLDDMLH